MRKDWVYNDNSGITTDWRIKNIINAPKYDNITACAHLPGMDKVLVILKTGATEALDKIPVHLRTTLECVQHYVIFSDFEEYIYGVHVQDVLRSVSEGMKQTNSDFGIYNRLRASGRHGLTADDWRDDENGPLGKQGNPGWKLDKWKFVPMIDEALLASPGAHWYVFLEADTYIIWRNMVRWLSQLDQRKALYLGAPMQMGSQVFAYGGAGIVLSRTAMRLISQYRAQNFTAVEQMTADDWAGDHVLGRILGDIGVSLIWSWPLLVPSSVWEFEYFTKAYGRQPWCYPAVSFHHMSTQDIWDMWLLEQQWFRYQVDVPLLHKDIFSWKLYDAISSMKDDWDNISSDQQPRNISDSPTTSEECKQRCSLITDCLQFSFSHEGCWTSKKVVGGVPRQGFHSGWVATRIKALMKNAGKCSKAQYITG
ncbi:hypothetical protein BDW60DRAFT_216580 [Aspergillus nidulans var. acristatus]